jgi:hypothetical protein
MIVMQEPGPVVPGTGAGAPAPGTRRAGGAVPVPPRSAPFDQKMAYYRSQHTTAGIRATHLVGIPVVAAALPLLAARRRSGVAMFVGGWALQVLGHVAFEKNSPALRNGVLTYQLCGLAFWCEEMADLISRVGSREGISAKSVL